MKTMTPDYFEQQRNSLDDGKWVGFSKCQFNEFLAITLHARNEFITITYEDTGLISVRFK